ncbi:MAG: AMP phosphorylase [Candidatus Bathyarchaeota archaeon]|nr:MAG: AMP phosphorylase [Candidatus Bathyarchaeota archaeon]
MELRAKILEIEAGGNLIVVLSKIDAERMGVLSNDRVMLRLDDNRVVTIINISSEFPEGHLGVYREVKSRLDLEEGDILQISPVQRPESLGYIREKILGERLTPWKLGAIVRDVVERHLSDIELASFVTALQIHGTSMEEVEALSRAMVRSGRTIKFDKGIILDKHSIGGVPGDKTTLVVVPIVAAAGFTIPKSSSRAITSPAGTADRMEALSPVDLRLDQIKEVISEVGACIVWGGSLDLAPADDLFIRVEYPLSIDPLLLPSIMSKKAAMGSTHVIVDIPVGIGAKITTRGQAEQLAMNFIELGERLGMSVECVLTEGGQPVGNAIGPVLEAREALETLAGRGPEDLIKKSTGLAGTLLEMVGENDGQEKAQKILSSGRALEKMRQIIEAQGGDPDKRPEDLAVGEHWVDVEASRSGNVLWISNRALAHLAREAGAPGEKGLGLLLHVKTGDKV